MDQAALRLILVDMAVGSWPSVLMVCLFETLMSEIRSIRHRETLIIPTLHKLALQQRINPILLLLPVTKVSCVALVLPVPNYPNALLWDYVGIPTSDLVRFTVSKTFCHLTDT